MNAVLGVLNLMKWDEYSRKGAQRAPSAKLLGKMRETIEPNLNEMAFIVELIVNARVEKEAKKQDSSSLLSLSSYFYEFYLEAEEAMVFVAKVSGKWVPHTLDWHERILKLLQSSQEGLRPPVLSPQTARSLQKYMFFYLTFHRHCYNPSLEKIEELVEDIESTYHMFKKDLEVFCRIMEQLF